MVVRSMKGRVALVTGSSRGLGRVIAKHLAAQGAKVALNHAHHADDAKSALAEVREVGEAAMFKADVFDERGVRKLVEQVGRELGPVEILVVNATPPQRNRRIDQYAESDFRSMIDAFLMSPHFLTRAVMDGMKARGYGRIIHITSEVFHEATANFSAYIGGKGAQIGYMRASAVELAPHGITVNAVAPGWIPVERHVAVPEAALETYRQTIPAGRLGTPQEVAAAVAYFAGEDAGFVTGQTLVVNGGRTLL